CAGRIVSILEGGYSGEGLAGGTSAHVKALMRA
ncbi:MAG: Acetoin utilization protein, partial [Massilia sp.]|nr:Acetoin utilization protein [Massilia sp.]